MGIDIIRPTMIKSKLEYVVIFGLIIMIVLQMGEITNTKWMVTKGQETREVILMYKKLQD